MTKSDLILKLTEKNYYLFQKDIYKIIHVFFDSISEALENGERVELRGFGAFGVKKRKARIGIRSVFNNTENRAVNLFEPLLEKLSGLSKLRKIYESDIHGCAKQDFLTKAFEALHMNFHFDEEQLANIPAEGPVIVVANHPYGIHDSLLMAALLQKARGENYRMMANSFFSASRFDFP